MIEDPSDDNCIIIGYTLKHASHPPHCVGMQIEEKHIISWFPCETPRRLTTPFT